MSSTTVTTVPRTPPALQGVQVRVCSQTSRIELLSTLGAAFIAKSPFPSVTFVINLLSTPGTLTEQPRQHDIAKQRGSACRNLRRRPVGARAVSAAKGIALSGLRFPQVFGCASPATPPVPNSSSPVLNGMRSYPESSSGRGTSTPTTPAEPHNWPIDVAPGYRQIRLWRRVSRPRHGELLRSY
jgi:hypothetical protein